MGIWSTMNIFKRARTRYILHRHAIGHHLWSKTVEKLTLLHGMTAVRKRTCEN
jgi:hypothetical protein